MLATLFSQHRRLLGIASALIAIAAIAGAVAWQRYFRAPSETAGAILPSDAGTPPPPSAQAGTPQPAAPAYTGAAVQTLNPDSNILKQVPTDTYEKSRNELAEFAVALAANPRSTDGWMRVAFIKRFYGDYAGAADAYEYLNAIASGDPLPFYNLAGLYGYYLGEPAKAVPKYQAAIQRDPMNPTYYNGFADFYRDTGNLAAAEGVLEQGLAKIPTEANLMISYAALSKLMGKVSRAILYYEKVLASATLSADQRAAITAEIERLK